jgi:hypothetical protein
MAPRQVAEASTGAGSHGESGLAAAQRRSGRLTASILAQASENGTFDQAGVGHAGESGRVHVFAGHGSPVITRSGQRG